MEAKGIVAASQPKWIPVTERLPEKDKNVLIFIKDGDATDSIMVDFIDSTGQFFWNGSEEITHWMPLPAPPKAGE